MVNILKHKIKCILTLWLVIIVDRFLILYIRFIYYYICHAIEHLTHFLRSLSTFLFGELNLSIKNYAMLPFATILNYIIKQKIISI